MNIADKTRLHKLIGMLGSAYDGERANAARMIEELARKYKLTITELMAQAYAEPAHHSSPEGESLLDQLARFRDHPVLTRWEQTFCSDVSARYGDDAQLSEKQLVVVNRIIAKCKRAETWG